MPKLPGSALLRRSCWTTSGQLVGDARATDEMTTAGDRVDPNWTAGVLARADAPDEIIEASARRLTTLAPTDPYGQLLPGLGSKADIPVPMTLSVRLTNRLAANGIWYVADLLPLAPADLTGWRNMGATSLNELHRWLIQEHLAAEPSPASRADSPADADPPRSALDEALSEVMAYAVYERGALTLRGAAEAAADVDAPPEVREALEVLSGANLSELGSTRRAAYDLADAVTRVLQELEGPTQLIFVSRTLAVGARPTLDDLGRELAFSRERVRQLQQKGVERVRAALAEPAAAALRRTASRLRRRLGTAAPRAAFAQLTERLPGVAGDATVGALLLWLAGPYEVAEEWLVLAADASAAQRTFAAVSAHFEDGEVDLSRALQAVVNLGIPPEYARDWLDHIGRFVVIGDRVRERPATRIAWLVFALAELGEPSHRDEIFRRAAELSGDEFGDRSAANMLTSGDAFVRVDRHRFALREWGGREYRGLVDEMLERVDKARDGVPLTELIRELTNAFDVAEASVRTYAAAHPFRIENGLVKMRTDVPVADLPSDDLLAATRHCYWWSGRWWYRTRVDRDLLRGSGRPMPKALADLLQMKQGELRELQSDSGAFKVSRRGAQATLGSLRAVAAADGAVDGWLFLGFRSGRRDAWVRAVAASEADASEGLGRAALLCGLSPEVADVTAIAQTLRWKTSGRDPDELRWELIDHFNRRGEPEIAELLV